MSVLCVFFFSSRRRHTRWTGDWSSDVCSSDLAPGAVQARAEYDLARAYFRLGANDSAAAYLRDIPLRFPTKSTTANALARSEERRVGEECRTRGSPSRHKKLRDDWRQTPCGIV